MEIQKLREFIKRMTNECDYAQVPLTNELTKEKIDLLKNQLRSSVQNVKDSIELIRDYTLLLVKFSEIVNKYEDRIKSSQKQTIGEMMIDLNINYTKTNEENE